MSPRSGQDSDTPARLLLIDAAPERDAFAAEFVGCLPALPEVVVVKTGRQALEALRAGPCDLVLMDLDSLADLSAPPEDAVARLVKAADGALIIALSKDNSVSVAVGVMRAGAHDVAARPFTAAEMASRLGRLAARHGRGRRFGVENGPAASERGDLATASSQMEAVGRLLGWPGDMRQLQGIIQRLQANFDGTAANSALAGPVRAGRQAILPMWQQEQHIIEEAIASFAGNIALAAAALELSPSTIYRKRQAWAAMEARKGAA